MLVYREETKKQHEVSLSPAASMFLNHHCVSTLSLHDSLQLNIILSLRRTLVSLTLGFSVHTENSNLCLFLVFRGTRSSERELGHSLSTATIN